jgi:hypothetical protein
MNYKILLLIVICLTFRVNLYGSSIFGWVVDNQDLGIYGVSVKLYQDQAHLQETMTDAKGFYSFDCLLEGNYKIKFEAKDWTTNTVEGLNLSLGEEKIVNQILQVSKSSGSVNGDLFVRVVRVVNGDKFRPEPFIPVVIRHVDKEQLLMKQTDKCGETNWLLEPGEYFIEITHDSFKTVEEKVAYEGGGKLVEIVLESN